MPIYGYMLPNLSPSPNLYKIQSVYNNNVALHVPYIIILLKLAAVVV